MSVLTFVAEMYLIGLLIPEKLKLQISFPNTMLIKKKTKKKFFFPKTFLIFFEPSHYQPLCQGGDL